MIGWLVMVWRGLDSLDAETPWGRVAGTIKVPGMVGYCPIYESKGAAEAAHPDAPVYEIAVPEPEPCETCGGCGVAYDPTTDGDLDCPDCEPER